MLERRVNAILFVALLSTSMGQTLVFSILPSLARELDLAEVQMGAVITASSIIFAYASPLWGNVSDRLGRKPVMMIGLFGYCFGTLLFASMFVMGRMGIMQGTVLFAGLIATRMIQSIVMSATNPSVTAYVADITNVSNRTSGMARLGAAQNLGTILGPAVGGGLAVWGLLMPMWFAAMATFVAGIIAWRVLPVPKIQAHFKRGERLSYFDHRVVSYIVIAVAMFTAFAIVQQTLGYRLQDLLGLTPQEGAHSLAICLMSGAVCSLAAQVICVQGSKWPPERLLKVGGPVLLIGLILLLCADRLTLFVAAVSLVGFGTGLMSPGFSSLASLAVESHEQGGVAGLLGAAPGLGFIIGPILGTALYQVEPHLPYAVTVLIIIPLVPYIWTRTHRVS